MMTTDSSETTIPRRLTTILASKLIQIRDMQLPPRTERLISRRRLMIKLQNELGSLQNIPNGVLGGTGQLKRIKSEGFGFKVKNREMVRERVKSLIESHSLLVS